MLTLNLTYTSTRQSSVYECTTNVSVIPSETLAILNETELIMLALTGFYTFIHLSGISIVSPNSVEIR